MSNATPATQFNPAALETAPAIEVENVQHFYGTAESRKQVLFDNSLTVKPGEIVIMTGQSGSGKTTLLTLIGTLRRVQEGKMWVLGQPLHDPLRIGRPSFWRPLQNSRQHGTGSPHPTLENERGIALFHCLLLVEWMRSYERCLHT